ncbi:uncharacterized protein LOC114911879 [Scleropages formosus]|nr:uncharacterized protein LOC114911879 [Scleropages formosus]
MARRIVAFVDDDGEGDGVPLGLLGDDSVTIQHLAAQVKKLQQQVEMLTSAFSMSVDLQHSLLQQLEIQTSSHSQGPDTHAHPMFTSTPATRTLTKRNSRDAEDSQHSHGQDAGAHPGHTSLTAAHTLSECTARSCPHPPLVSSAHLSGLVPPKFDGGDSIDPEDWLQSVSLYKTAVGLPDTRFFLELTRLFEREPRKWYSAMQPHLLSWEHFSDLFRQAFLPTDNEEKIWRGILDSVQASEESLPTFVAHLVTEFKRLRQPPSEQEQIEVICRHVSDQYRLALHAAAPTTLTELLLTAHELHAALGPISPNRTATSAQLTQRPNLHCYKCFTPGVTTRNCGTCRKTRQSGNTEPGGGAAASPQADQENPNAPQDTRGDPGARPRRFQRPRGGNQNLEPGPSVQSTGGSHSVNLVQDSPRKSKNSPLSSVVMVNQVFLKATLDTGASISAVHPSTLLRCGINEDIVLPWTFSPLELADSKQCTPSGVVWLPVSLLGHLFTHRFAVIPDLSCPILLGTDFMIQADVHIHPATGNVRLGDNANYAPDLGLLEGEFGDLEGHVACLTFKDTKVDFIPVLDQAALLPADKERLASLLRDFEYLFSGKLGKTSLVAHIIDTGTAKPVCLPPYRASPAKRKIIEEQISKMLEDAHFTWSPECQQSFDHLKLRLTRAPVLVLPNFGKPFTVHTDACDVGLGAALTQTGEDGLERAVAFASRTLHKSERLYSTSEKECLGVIWALEHFRPYVEGSYVTVVTDHNSLRWLMSRPSPSGRLARWCLRLQDFDFEVVHRPGSANLVPDALSRNPACDPTEPVDLLPSYATIGSLNLRRQPLLILEDKQQLKSLQQGDQVIASLFTELESGSCVDSTDFCIQDGLVYFMDKRASCRLHPLKALRFYVPGLLRGTLLRYFHDHPMGGHLGITKTLGRLQRRVYWPGMRGDVKRYVQSCVTCQLSKPANQKPGGYLKPVVATYPWEFAGVDFMGPLPRSGRGNEYILVFIDYFTKWVEICPVREATAATAARKFVSEVFARHGAPAHLVSDRGVQFVSDFFEEVVAAMGSDHRLTTAYHPQSNQTERVNRTIKTAIRAYVGRKHRDWDLHLPLISFALRTAPHQSTGDTPAFLLYGRDLNTPLDLWLSPSPQYMADSVADYKVELTSALREAYDHVRESLAESQSTQKKHYDKNRRAVSFQVGDLVKLKAHPRSDASAGFSAKLAPVYKGPYRITKVLSELNYKLSRVADAADGGVHHVSNLLPFFTWDDKEDLECLPQQLAETNLQEQEACVPDEQDVFGFDTLFTEPDVHDQLAAAPTVGTQPPSVDSPVVTPPVNFSSPRADAHLQHPQLVRMHTHPYFLRSGCAGDSCLTYAQPFHAETRSFSQHPTHPTQPAHTAHPYLLRPRRTPRVTSGWDVNRWTNPYFALQFGF